mgnify:CR=1 FL=1
MFDLQESINQKDGFMGSGKSYWCRQLSEKLMLPFFDLDEQIESHDALEAIVKQIVAENPANVEKFKSGNDRIFAFFVGQAMKATQGRANPNILAELFKKHLS